MSFVSDVDAATIAPETLGGEIEQDAADAITRLDEADGEAKAAREEASQVLAALERAHVRLANRLGRASPFTPSAPDAPQGAMP